MEDLIPDKELSKLFNFKGKAVAEKGDIDFAEPIGIKQKFRLSLQNLSWDVFKK